MRRMRHRVPIHPDSSAVLADAADLLQSIHTEHWVPGISVGVLADGEEHYLGSGQLAVPHGEQVGPCSRFRAASVSKVVTATALMRLTEFGHWPRVDLDEPVASVLPGFQLADPLATRTVTPRQLAAHRGGWASNVFENRPAGEQDDDALARAVGELANAQQISPVGRFYSYSNSGFAVLGRIIELAMATSFEAATDELLFMPMSLHDTWFPRKSEVSSNDLALGHTGTPPRLAHPWSRSRARSPSGGLITTSPDLIRFARCLLDGGAGVIEPGSVRAMWEPVGEAVGFADRIGVGWNTNHLDDGTPFVSHGGNTGGYVTLFSIVPARRLAVAILANSSVFPQAADLVHDWVTHYFLGRIRRRLVPAGTGPPPATGEYCGTYTDGVDEVLVTHTDGGVRVAPKGREHDLPHAEVRFSGPDHGRIVLGGTNLVVRFLRDDGPVRWLRVSGLVFRKVTA